MEIVKTKLSALSLFANVGISECYLEESAVSVVIANEIDQARGKFYKHLYPNTEMVIGDITEKDVFDDIIRKSKERQVDTIFATPPCQGMSSAGKNDPLDVRNSLIMYAVKAIHQLNPKYVFLENVPEQLHTSIQEKGKDIKIPDFLEKELGEKYHFSQERLVNAADFGVAQLRERAIFLLTRKDQKFRWEIPEKNQSRKTMEDAIGHLPPLDPIIYDVDPEIMKKMLPNYEESHEIAKGISPWHSPPRHVQRQVFAIQHTPTGKSAFENEPDYQPKKKDGNRVRGYKNTYKRQNWDKPAYTVTMYNRTIGSQNNVHPGRPLENGLHSDPRVLTVYEIMLIMSLPENWNIPPWASENFVRSVMGEGIPPLFMQRIVRSLTDEIQSPVPVR